eukprot:s4694_g1.t1
MDGFEGNSGVIVVAATTRPEFSGRVVAATTNALLRPGRFDRRVTVGLPDAVKGREEILNVHIRNKKLAEDAALTEIAKRRLGRKGIRTSFAGGGEAAERTRAHLPRQHNPPKGPDRAKRGEEPPSFARARRAPGVARPIGSIEDQVHAGLGTPGGIPSETQQPVLPDLAMTSEIRTSEEVQMGLTSPIHVMVPSTARELAGSIHSNARVNCLFSIVFCFEGPWENLIGVPSSQGIGCVACLRAGAVLSCAIAFPLCPLSATVFLVVVPRKVVGQMIRSLQGQLTALSHRADSLQVAVVELAEEISKLTTPGAFGDWALVDDQFPPLPAAEFQALLAIHRRRGIQNGPPDLPDECLRIASRAMIFSSGVILDRARDAFNSGFEAKVALVTGNPFLKDPLASSDKHRHWVCLYRRTPDYNKRLSTKKCLDIALAIEEDVVWQGFEFVAELVIFCAGAGLSVPRLERWVSPW